MFRPSPSPSPRIDGFEGRCFSEVRVARIRTIKPEFFTDDDVAELEPMERLLFIGLWTQADRAGRMDDKPRALKARLFPYDAVDVDVMLAKLADRGFVRRYVVLGERYMEIPKFTEHQVINGQERDSGIPGPEQADSGPENDAPEAVKTPVEAPKTTRLDALGTRGSTRDDASNTRRDAYPQEGKGRKGKEGKERDEKSLEPTSDAGIEFFAWAQDERNKATGAFPEPPPPGFNGWWSGATSKATPEQLKGAWRTYLGNDWALKLKPSPCPWKPFSGRWAEYVPSGPSKTEPQWRTIADDEDPYADQMQPPVMGAA